MFGGETITPRVQRHVVEHRKLLTKAHQVALIHPAVIRHATDHAVGESQAKAAFLAHDLAALQVWTCAGAFTVLLLPLRLYYRPIWRRRAMELKRYLRSTGKRCLVAPASYLDRQPRLQNAKLVAASKRVQVSITDRLVILAKADEAMGVSLGEASMCVSAKDPAAAVLNLVAERALIFDPDLPLGPHTMLQPRSMS